MINRKSQRAFSKTRLLIATFLVFGATALGVKLVFSGPSKLSDDQLYDLVSRSTLTFTGTVVDTNRSNVEGIGKKDFPMIVRVDDVDPNQPALAELGSLKGTELTVATNSAFFGLTNNASAVFCVEPWIYDKYIGVIANQITFADRKSGQDFSKRLHEALLRKLDVALQNGVAKAILIITGEVETVQALASNKAAALGSVHNGWELRSEHRPRWKEAIVKITTVEQQTPNGPQAHPGDRIALPFPSSHDCFGASSPRFTPNETGIWLLYRTQLDDQETKVLLQSESYEGQDIQSYTALAPADFVLNDSQGNNLKHIQQLIAKTKRNP